MRAWIIHARCGDDYVFGWKIRSLSSAREKHCLTRDAIQQCGCEVIKPLLDDGRCIFNEAARWDGRTAVVNSEGRPAPRSRDLTGSQTQHVGNILITLSIRTFKICRCVVRSQQAGSSWSRETFHRCRKRSGHFSALIADCVGSVLLLHRSGDETSAVCNKDTFEILKVTQSRRTTAVSALRSFITVQIIVPARLWRWANG